MENGYTTPITDYCASHFDLTMSKNTHHHKKGKTQPARELVEAGDVVRFHTSDLAGISEQLLHRVQEPVCLLGRAHSDATVVGKTPPGITRSNDEAALLKQGLGKPSCFDAWSFNHHEVCK